MLETWPELIKKLVGLDTIWGGRSKKLTGVDDYCEISSGTMAFSAANQTITFSNPAMIPDWLKDGCYFRVTSGGPNTGKLFKVSYYDSLTNTITVTPGDVGVLIQDYVGAATLDGRMFVVINDPSVARQSSTGGSMFNANITTPPRPELGGIIYNRVDHFHTQGDNPTVATTPIIYNLTLPVAGTEYNYALPANTKQFSINARGIAKLNLAFSPGQTTTDYVTIFAGSKFKEYSVSLASTSIYLLSNKPNEVVEILSWV